MALTSFPSASDIDLIISDVDGTLLDSTHKIHPRTLSALHAIRSKNPDLPIVIASGKQYNSCQWIREALNLPGPEKFPAIHCNGCVIYAEGGIVERYTLDPEEVVYLVENTGRYGTFLFTDSEAILVTRGEGVHEKDWCTIAGAYDTGVRDGTHEQENILRKVKEGTISVVKVTICTDEEDLKRCSSELTNIISSSPTPITLTRAIPFIFEAIPPQISKSTALLSISQRLSIPTSRILAFGDGENDMGMLSLAGYGVVMGNAMESVKEAGVAKYVTGTNDEGGMGMFLEKVWGL